MSEIDFAALVPFVVITLYTPGPNNVSSAAMAAKFGMRRTWSYMYGIATGFFILLTLSGLFSGGLMSAVPQLEGIVKWVGAAYILWLAWGLVKEKPGGDSTTKGDVARGFVKGMILQCVNGKAVVFSLTLYTVFFSSMLSRLGPVLLTALIIAVACLFSLILWASFGAGIDRFMGSPSKRRTLNYGFALMLVVTAAQVAGLL